MTYNMCLGRLLQRIDLVDADLELAGHEQAEELARVMLKLLACCDVPKECRASNLDALWREAAGPVSIQILMRVD